MFLGVVHANARRILAGYIPRLPAHAHVICSGNFSIESTLRENGYRGTLTGCDVSLYTCALGHALAGQDFELSVNEVAFPEFAPLSGFMDSQDGRAAAVAVVLDALRFYKRSTEYNRRMFSAYRRRLEELCEATRQRIRNKRETTGLNSFHAQDGWERIGDIPDGDEHVVLSFAPTYTAGYEKLYKALHEAFRWHAPDYKLLTSGSEFARRIVERPGPWVYGAELPDEDLEAVVGKPVALAPRGSGVNVYLYSNLPVEPKLLRRHINSQDSRWPRLRSTDEITDDSTLTVHAVSSNETAYIRQLYSSVLVGQASAEYNFAVAVDGRLIGVLGFMHQTLPWGFEGGGRDHDSVYMMCDLAIGSDRYPRLSKLVLAAAISRETQQELESRLVRNVDYCVTTAFSRNPSSMKYRGLFRLHSREQEPGGNYKLNYYAKMGRRTLSESLTAWVEKHVPCRTV